uniref:NWD NACHT-NTPase N-terminal domain-containing protein n=1 Tax=Talaromyces marneffei PM1 TaxID=1077442 RepID=A0A093V477_TALMA
MAPIWAKLESKLKITRRGGPEPALTSPSTSQIKPEPAHRSASSHSFLTIKEWLWNQAYGKLKASETKQPELNSFGSEGNKIGQNLETRSLQMQQLVQLGLERTQKAANIKGRIGDGLDVVDSLRGIMDQAVSASAEASIAWVGIFFGLEAKN